MRARMLENAAMTSESVEIEAGQMRCPECGTGLESRGKRKRKLKTTHNQEITLLRSYAQCPKCKAGFPPLDRELELLSGELTPQLQQSIARLATWMPFRRAVAEIKHFTRVEVSEATVRRITEQAGETLLVVGK